LKLRETETFPAIRVQAVSENQPMHLRGAVNLFRSLIQADIYVEDVGDAYATAGAIDAAVHGDGAGSGLSGYAGGIGSPAFEITGVLPRSRSESYELNTETGKRFVRVMREYEVHHRG
jgi:hypothetical protein